MHNCSPTGSDGLRHSSDRLRDGLKSLRTEMGVLYAVEMDLQDSFFLVVCKRSHASTGTVINPLVTVEVAGFCSHFNETTTVRFILAHGMWTCRVLTAPGCVRLGLAASSAAIGTPAVSTNLWRPCTPVTVVVAGAPLLHRGIALPATCTQCAITSSKSHGYVPQDAMLNNTKRSWIARKIMAFCFMECLAFPIHINGRVAGAIRMLCVSDPAAPQVQFAGAQSPEY